MSVLPGSTESNGNGKEKSGTSEDLLQGSEKSPNETVREVRHLNWNYLKINSENCSRQCEIVNEFFSEIFKNERERERM